MFIHQNKKEVVIDNIKNSKIVILTLLLVFVIGMTMPMVSGELFTPEKTQMKVKSKGRTLYATLTTIDGKPIAKKKIKFKVKGKTYYRTTNTKGVASIKFSSYSKINSWKFTATFIGDKQYKTSSKVGKIKKPTITITARPSCICKDSYKWRTRTFINKCPFSSCGKYGGLYNAHKRWAKSEQEITCRFCGADFCGNCGRDKDSHKRRLTRIK